VFNNEELKSFLSTSIQQSNRTWFAKKSCWVIVPDVLPDVISFSRHLFNHIDTSSLPINYQKIIQSVLQGTWDKSKNTVKSPLNSEGDHAELFLLDSAPEFVVKATYKALAKRYHPDGDEPDEDTFKRIKDAYESLLKSCDY
jgi:predicted negative regulator of RcsB-dependent stress response